MNTNQYKIMPHEEYLKIKHKTPYEYKLSHGNKLLYFFGAGHCYDPNDKQFKKLEEFWIDFLNKSNDKRVVVAETRLVDEPEDNLSANIRKNGETGAGAYFAKASNSKFVLGEPDEKKLVEYLLSIFSKEKVLIYFESIALIYWHKKDFGNKGISMNAFISKHDNKYRELLGWPNLSISVELLEKLYQTEYGEALNAGNVEQLQRITDPAINKLSEQQSTFRNQYLFNTIKNYWESGHSIFVIYGAGHAVMLEPALKKIVCD